MCVCVLKLYMCVLSHTRTHFSKASEQTDTRFSPCTHTFFKHFTHTQTLHTHTLITHSHTHTHKHALLAHTYTCQSCAHSLFYSLSHTQFRPCTHFSYTNTFFSLSHTYIRKDIGATGVHRTGCSPNRLFPEAAIHRTYL